MQFPKIHRKIKRVIEEKRLFIKYRPSLEKNKKLKDVHKGKRCFIIGTGPSIKDQDLTKLKDEYTFVVNTFWNHPYYVEVNPSYYVITDPEVFPRSSERGEFNWKQFIEHLPTIKSCPSEFFFPISAKELIENQHLLDSRVIHYLVLKGHFNDNLKFNIELDKVIPTTKNVILAALIIATYMGFEKIYLLGCEHSFLAQPAYKYYESFKEFYKTDHSDTDPRQIKERALDIMSYEGHIHHVAVLFKNYRLFKEKLAKEKPGVKIYNATPNSYLDVFPMINFGEIGF